MYHVLQQDDPEDCVIATGTSYSLREFVEVAFESAKLKWQDHVVIDQSLYRPSEISVGQGNPRKALEKLTWVPQYKMSEVVKSMLFS